MPDTTSHGKHRKDPEPPLYLAEASAYYETALQHSWSRIPLNVKFPLKFGGKSFRILSRGVWNMDAGPDFLNAELEIDGKIRRGDVEIHRRSSDWARHGHDSEDAYRSVILHAVGIDDVAGANAPKTPLIPLFILPNDFSAPRFRRIPPRGSEGLCAAFFARLPDEALLKFIADAGLERMRLKSNALMADMIRNGACNAFLSKLFSQIGVAGNRRQFQELAQRILGYPEETRKTCFHALLWGESGRLPDPSKTKLPPDAEALVRNLWNIWWPLRRKAVEPLQFSPHCRPLNSVERRIALLSGFLKTFGENPLPALLTMVESNPVGKTMRLLSEKLNLSDEFWMTHTSFHSLPLSRPNTLIGHDRIIELLANVLIPGVHAYATLLKESKLISRIETVYLQLPKSASNKTLRTAIDACIPGRGEILATAASGQGLLHLYKTYCEPLAFHCKTCPIYRLC